MHMFLPPFIHSFIHSFNHSFIDPSINSFIRPFICCKWISLSKSRLRALCPDIMKWAPGKRHSLSTPWPPLSSRGHAETRTTDHGPRGAPAPTTPVAGPPCMSEAACPALVNRYGSSYGPSHNPNRLSGTSYLQTITKCTKAPARHMSGSAIRTSQQCCY